MAIHWTDEERTKIEDGISRHGIRTGRCAALARIVHPIARQQDPDACAIRLRPLKGAIHLVPKVSHIPYWHEHVYVETRAHAVDAITGADGYAPSNTYVNDHWEFAESMRVEKVDPTTVDPGIQDVDEAS